MLEMLSKISVGIKTSNPITATRKVPGGRSDVVTDAARTVNAWATKANGAILQKYLENSIIFDLLGVRGFASSFDKPIFMALIMSRVSMLDLR